MRDTIDEVGLRRKIIEEAMGKPQSPGVTALPNGLVINRLPKGCVSPNGANWEATDTLNGAAVIAAIDKAQNMYDLH
ncbi:hypothetical protein O6027_16930 [Sphingomonas aerolata]|jgi:hypothetical protein|uniref:hypothetical protein n=1 Tax=Sphingomonas aerolata TaxID=185951 RepID=UPI0033532253